MTYDENLEDSIQADIYIAKHIFYDNDGKDAWHRNPQLLNMCAYHCEQAIEKTLKLFLQKISDEAYRSMANTHSISELLVKLQCFSDNFIENHMEISFNAETLSKMNNLRYGNGDVTKDDCHIVIHCAKKLFQEYQDLYGKKNIRILSSLDGYKNKKEDTEKDKDGSQRKVNYTLKRVNAERD